MVTIKDISKASGFSQAVISRLFRGDETLSITPKTRKKIITTALAMGYDRGKIKTSLEKIAIFFWLDENQLLQDLYYKKAKEALLKYSKLVNLELVFITPKQGIQTITDDISGFISFGFMSSKELQSLKNRNLRGVVIEMNPLTDDFDTVKPDTDRITRKSIDNFINSGFTKIGFIGGHYHDPETHQEGMDSREKEFRDYLSTKDLLRNNYIFTSGLFTVDEGYKLAMKMVQECRDDLPQACLIASDTIAIGVLQALNEVGIRIPDQLAIISINDDEFAKLVSPPLTTYRIEMEEIAKTALDTLTDQFLYPRKITKTILLGAELIVRKSFIPSKSDE